MILERFRKKRHYQDKINISYKKMWDMEFLKKKLTAMKEGFRLEYDRLNEMNDAARMRIEAEKAKADPDKTILDNLQKMIERQEPDIEQLKKQMEGIDGQIEGENGVEGTIDGLRTVIDLLREHKKKV